VAAAVPTFAQFQAVLRGTPMAKEAKGIYNAALAGGINPAFVAGLAGAESNFGAAGYARGRFNPYGFGVHQGTGFKNYTQATQAMIKGLRDPKGYYKDARTLPQFINVYSPPSENNTQQHIRNITSIGRRTGGDPSIVVIGRQTVPTGTAPIPAGVQPPAPTASSNSIDRGTLGRLISQQYRDTASGDIDLDQMRRTSLEVANVVGQNIRARAVPSAMGVAQDPTKGSVYGGADVSMAAIPRSAKQVRLSKWGGPDDHGSRALGDWQSDMAYDLGSPAGTVVTNPLAGRVVRISGAPGSPKGRQFAGYGVTVDYGGGKQLFFKHLGRKNVSVGQRITPGSVVGTLDPTTAGGSHLHLGASSRPFLNSVLSYYTGG